MDNYLIAWGVYLLSALGLLLVFWRMTIKLPPPKFRIALRTLAVVVLLTPINIVESDIWLAPAYLVGSYDWVLGNHERATLALVSIGVAYALALGLVLLSSTVKRILGIELNKGSSEN